MFYFKGQDQTRGNQVQWNFIPFIYPDGSGSPVFFVGSPTSMWTSWAERSQQATPLNPSIQPAQQVEQPQIKKDQLTEQKKLLNSNSLKEASTKKKGQSNMKSQEQFKPYAFGSKKKRNTPQNINRNVAPNIIHQILSFLQKKSKSQKLVQKLMNQDSFNQGSIRRFYLYQTLIKDRMYHYVNVQSLETFKTIQEPECELYSEDEQKNYLKISRMLIQYFLKQEFQCIILTSKRVNSNKKQDHLHYRRIILEQLQQMLRC